MQLKQEIWRDSYMSDQDIELEIQSLPVGYISRKVINGKQYSYLQWREDGKVRSRYLKKGEAELVAKQIGRRNALIEQLQKRKQYARLNSYREQMMSYPVAVGIQSYEKLRVNNLFYVDKTEFIYKWWKSFDEVTLITRPRRFGKTLMLDTVETFFSTAYSGREELFSDTDIWRYPDMRKLQGRYPVISLTFGGIKCRDFLSMKKDFGLILYQLYENAINQLRNRFQMDLDPEAENSLLSREIVELNRIKTDLYVGEHIELMARCISILSEKLYRIYGEKVLILLDEYDTPVQEAFHNGHYEETLDFMRVFFFNTFKSNRYMERGLITGITRISKESIFSDMNHLSVHGLLDIAYSEYFGFTENEVLKALRSQSMDKKETVRQVRDWYDGFRFGNCEHIYNPWSVLSFLQTGVFRPYWVNTGSNRVVRDLILKSTVLLKGSMEKLLAGESITCAFREDIVFDDLYLMSDTVWNLLLTAGYLKLDFYPEESLSDGELKCSISLTNKEVARMMEDIVRRWFREEEESYNGFIHALLDNKLDDMNEFMNRVSLSAFSTFDTGAKVSETIAPERFYHGFVLGLLVELQDQYIVKSNRESGLGRYDVCLIPKDKGKKGFILEFKVYSERKESGLEETVQNALMQIKDRKYETELIQAGVRPENIFCYGFAFRGKTVLIGGSMPMHF